MIEYTNEFLNDVCNWGDRKNYIFSIDVDFVPDYILKDTINLFKRYEQKSTIFLTHKTQQCVLYNTILVKIDAYY